MADEVKLLPLSQAAIDACFADARDGSEVLDRLYRLAYPSDWEQIKSINGYPEVSAETHHYIGIKFIRYDQEHHPEYFAGGLWMNNGFGEVRGMPDWQVRPAPVEYNQAGQ